MQCSNPLPFKSSSLNFENQSHFHFGSQEDQISAQFVSRPLPYHQGITFTSGKWHNLLYGYINTIFDHQGGPRGCSKLFALDSFLFIAKRQIGTGTFSFRLLTSLEPFTVGRYGYPVLFVRGGAINCKCELIDGYYAQDLISELAISFVQPIKDFASVFFYLGIPGDPSIGPFTYQRISSFYIPEVALAHTIASNPHVRYGVLTAGVRVGMFQIEGCAFNSTAPYGSHIKYQDPQFNSLSTRISLYPTENIISEISYAYLRGPSILSPTTNDKRLSLAITYNKLWDDNFWQTTFAVARNVGCPLTTSLNCCDAHPCTGTPVVGSFIESSVNFAHKHIVYGRINQFQTPPLTTPSTTYCGQSPLGNVARLDGGYTYQFRTPYHLQFGFGTALHYHVVGKELSPNYGKNPWAFFLFLRIELVK